MYRIKQMVQWQARTKVLFIFILGFVALLLTRFYGLEFKPIHHDESTNIWWVSEIWRRGFFPYDPTNYHGPLLFYLFQFLEVLGLDRLGGYRGLTSLFNALSVIMIVWWSIKSNYKSWWLAGLMMLLSPAMIFYGRSAIHEAPFVFFQIMAFIGCIDIFTKNNTDKVKARGVKLLLWGFLGTTLLKETFVLTLFSGIVAFGYLYWSSKSEKYLFSQNLKKEFKKQFLITFGIWVLMYSAFFAMPGGLWNFFAAFMPWLSTGTSSGHHEKSFFYWLELILKHETLTFIMVLISLGGFFIQSKLVKALSLFSFVNLLVYSIIPYKTPWCLISILWPFYFSGLASAEKLLAKLSSKQYIAAVVVLIIVSGYQFAGAVGINYKNPINHQHDYVYVQTTEVSQAVFDYIQDLTELSPEFKSDPILLHLADPWPFPTVLKDFNSVYSLPPEQTAIDLSEAPKFIMVITSADLEEQQKLFERLGGFRAQPCHVKFSEDLEPCQFVIRDGSEVLQIIFSEEAGQL